MPEPINDTERLALCLAAELRGTVHCDIDIRAIKSYDGGFYIRIEHLPSEDSDFGWRDDYDSDDGLMVQLWLMPDVIKAIIPAPEEIAHKLCSVLYETELITFNYEDPKMMDKMVKWCYTYFQDYVDPEYEE